MPAEPTVRESPLRSVARPKQARSELTLQRILDAAEAIIAEKGLVDASIPEIVRRAGSSVGGFYARFTDKNELLWALEERFFNQLSARLEALLAPARWEKAAVPEIVRAGVVELVTVFREKESLIAAFLYRAAQEPGFREDGLRFRRRVAQELSALLLGRGSDFRHPDPALAIDLGVQFAFGLMTQQVVFGEVRAGGRPLSDRDLQVELVRNFLAYLGVTEDAD